MLMAANENCLKNVSVETNAMPKETQTNLTISLNAYMWVHQVSYKLKKYLFLTNSVKNQGKKVDHKLRRIPELLKLDSIPKLQK